MNKINFNRLALMVIMCMVSVSAFCVPAKRVWRTMTLTDGTTVEAMMIGDEHGHWFVDHNGKALRLHDNDKAEYITTAQLENLKALRKERLAKCNARRVENIKKTRALAEQATLEASSVSSAKNKTFGKPTTITGTKRGLVILVNYSDKSFKEGNDQALFNERFNTEGYTNDKGYIGSVHDYFYDQSYGKFNLTFDVVGPVTVSKKHDYYGANDLVGNDKYAATMVIEAIKLADDNGVDFSKYDWDGDGNVEQVFVIYAGTGENSSGMSTDIWPHEYNLTNAEGDNDGSGPVTVDGVTIDTYAVSCELANSSTIDGIGTACHEFSHCLGYADLYDTDYSGGQGMESWDLLDNGSYNGPNSHGEVPPAYTSFERWWAGWMDLNVINTPQFITDMPALNDEAVAYKIINEANPNEYYLLENRQAKKWDSYTGGHGMLILHVDYDETVWSNNSPNNDPTHQRMTFIPADNSYGSSSRGGDPYPGTSKNTSFTDETTPAATLYNANSDGRKFMGKPITDIAETDGMVSFTFMGGIEIPVATEATEITSDGTSFTANWNAVEGADSYDLEISEYSKSKDPLLSEDFSTVESAVSSYDISDKLPNGWTGSKVFYSEAGVLKIGASKNGGYITSPSIDAPSTGCATVKINASYYGTDNSTITISTGDKLSAVQLSNKLADYVVTQTDINSAFNVTITCGAKERFFLSSVDVYDGTYTAEELSGSSAKPISKAAATTRIIAGIKDNHYSLTDLTSGVNYRYHVRANVGTTHTAWSDYIKVESTTGINDILVDEPNNSQRIYNLKGQYVGSDLSKLSRGIYIIGTRKVIKH